MNAALEPRPVAESRSELIRWAGIEDANSAGFVHGGMVMKACDEAAAIAAIRHCRRRVVTAGMDRMTFTQPVHVGELLICRATVNAAWRTSLEVGVRVEAEDARTGERRHTSTAYVTMVALDDAGRPTPVPRVIAESEDEQRRGARRSCGGRTGSPNAIRSSTGVPEHYPAAAMSPSAELTKLAIVPAYNEEGMVGRVVRDIQPPGARASTCSSSTTARPTRPRPRPRREGAAVIRHPYNLGIGGAVQSGYKYALRHGYDVAVQVDGDGQHKPEYLPEMLARAADRRRRGRHGLRQPLPRRPRLQGPVRPPARQPDLLGRAHARSPASGSPTRPPASG